MRHPFWIVNSSLLVLAFIAVIIVVLTQQQPPRQASIEPTVYAKPVKQSVPETEIAKIYENDLFNTYQRPIPATEKKDLAQQLPPPPSPIMPTVPQEITPAFLEPLRIALRGVMIVGDNNKDRVLIENLQSKQEATYRVGDNIDDAQLIRILRNRIVILRSNGQEEIVYLREKDAQGIALSLTAERWENIIKKTGANAFSIDSDSFIEQVPTLAHFIESLDATTVYRQGKPFGARIGTMEQGSFGIELGLQTGDIITHILDIPTRTLQQRLDIVNKVASLADGAHIPVRVLRSGIESPLMITLEELGRVGLITTDPAPRVVEKPAKTPYDIAQEKEQLLKEKLRFAPVVDEIRQEDKRRALKNIKQRELQQQAEQRPPRFDI